MSHSPSAITATILQDASAVARRFAQGVDDPACAALKLHMCAALLERRPSVSRRDFARPFAVMFQEGLIRWIVVMSKRKAAPSSSVALPSSPDVLDRVIGIAPAPLLPGEAQADYDSVATRSRRCRAAEGRYRRVFYARCHRSQLGKSFDCVAPRPDCGGPPSSSGVESIHSGTDRLDSKLLGVRIRSRSGPAEISASAKNLRKC